LLVKTVMVYLLGMRSWQKLFILEITIKY